MKNTNPNLQNVRKALGLTADETAAAIGITPDLYKKFESGDAEIPTDKMAALTKWLRLPADFF